MRQLGARGIWEGFLEVELSQVLIARKKGERQERGPGKESCVNIDTKMCTPGTGVASTGQSAW